MKNLFVTFRTGCMSVQAARMLVFAFLVACMCISAGCTARVVAPDPIYAVRNEEMRMLHYSPRVVMTNEDAFWDMRNIKSNIAGLTEFQFVRACDVVLDAVSPGPERRPLENGIEWIKNRYAKLPPYAWVNIIGGFFKAVAPEKISYGRMRGFFPRLVYLTDWVQDSLGEVNRLAGYATPWGDRFIPRTVTAAPNRAVDRAQTGLLGGYLWLLQTLSHGIDRGIIGLQGGGGAVASRIYALGYGRDPAPVAPGDTEIAGKDASGPGHDDEPVALAMPVE